MNRGKYMVLFLSFNEVSDTNIEQRFNNYINSAIMGFSRRYHDASLLEDPIDINPSNAMDSFHSMLNAVDQSKHKLYLIVDEYDSFVNRLLLNIDTSVDGIALKQYSRLIASKESILRGFRNMAKSGSSSVIARMFFTGITPMAFCDAISGLNMVQDISSSLKFALTLGLSEDNIKMALSKLALSEEEQSEHLIKLRKHFNGYRFHPLQPEGVYNPQACLHYLQNLVETGKSPEPIFDTNIGVSSDNIVEFFVRHQHAEDDLMDKENPSFFYNFIFGHQPAEVKFDIRGADFFDESLSLAIAVSLAYHHGYLTYSKDAESKLVCPNLELKRILMQGLSRGNSNARAIVNEILKADELSDKNTRKKLFADFIDLVLKTAPNVLGKFR
jgi:hypothetical protein